MKLAIAVISALMGCSIDGAPADLAYESQAVTVDVETLGSPISPQEADEIIKTAQDTGLHLSCGLLYDGFYCQWDDPDGGWCSAGCWAGGCHYYCY